MNTRKFLQKISLSLIAIIPGILGLFFGYNKGQVTTQNKTIETFNGSQSIAANNLIVNYNSETDNYDDKLNEIIKNLSTSAQDNQELTSKNSQLIQENFTIQEENTQLKKDYP